VTIVGFVVNHCFGGENNFQLAVLKISAFPASIRGYFLIVLCLSQCWMFIPTSGYL